jgi:hypothetical protein
LPKEGPPLFKHCQEENFSPFGILSAQGGVNLFGEKLTVGRSNYWKKYNCLCALWF